MTNGGFQSYLHLMYGLPNGFIQAKTQPDTSDILNRGLKKQRKRKTEQELLEEQIAAQLLQAQQKDIVIPENVSPVSLSAILRDKLNGPILSGELKGKEREKRIKILLLALLMDD